MDECDDNWLLAHDAITEFLSGMDDLGAMNSFPHPQEKQSSSVSRGSTETHRERVSALQQEIEELHRHLRSLHEYQNRSDLQQSTCSCGTAPTNWKRRTRTERLLKDQAEHVNRQLKRRIRTNQQIAENVRSLLQKQLQAMPKRPRVGATLMDAGLRVYGVLSASLDAQHYHLAATLPNRLQDFKHQDVSINNSAVMTWRHRQLRHRLGIDMEAFDIMPISAAEFAAIVSAYAQLNTSPCLRQDIVDKVDQRQISDPVGTVTADNPAGSSEVEARSILRRVVTDQATLFLWESMSYWQTHDSLGKPKRAMVRESGWLIVSPWSFPNASMTPCKSSISIYSVDGSRIKKSNALVKGIISTTQKLFDMKARSVDNLLMDSQVSQKKQLDESQCIC